VNVAALGPFELYCGGRVVTLGAPKQKVVLALLVARANQTVPVCDLVNELWGDLPPASALANLRLYANNLRRLLAAGTGLPLVTRRGTGYVLVIDESLIDVYHFRASIRHGRAALLQGTYESAITYFDAGLRLWRGPVAADLPLGRLLTGWRAALKEERLSAVEDRDDALLRLGGHDPGLDRGHRGAGRGAPAGALPCTAHPRPLSGRRHSRGDRWTRYRSTAVG
jgi:DNA-binding SARP family transcriptional activator